MTNSWYPYLQLEVRSIGVQTDATDGDELARPVPMKSSNLTNPDSKVEENDADNHQTDRES